MRDAASSVPGVHGALGQLRRFATVGLVSNLLLYGAYLGLTSLGMAPKLAMSALYAFGVLSTYAVNSLWSFGRPRLSADTFKRYLSAQGLGYVFNFGLLWGLVDQLHLPHQAVQALAIVLVAVLLFALNRYWVFARTAGEGE